jgi:hypothetical protein
MGEHDNAPQDPDPHEEPLDPERIDTSAIFEQQQQPQVEEQPEREVQEGREKS